MSNTETVVTPEQLAALQAQVDQLKAVTADKDRIIGDLNATRATLEARVAGTQPVQPVVPVVNTADIDAEAQRIMEEGQTDPVAASKKLSGLITKVASSAAELASKKALDQVGPMMENNTFAASIRAENKDLLDIEPGMEVLIANRANEIMATKPASQRTFQEFQKTVREVIVEKRKVFEPLLKKPTEPAKPVVPAGAKGEAGGDRPAGAPPAVPATDNTDNTSASGRTAIAQSKGLF